MADNITRRDFMQGTTYAIFGMAVGFPQNPIKKSRVVLVRHPDALDEKANFIEEVIQEMLDDAVKALLNEESSKKAFQKLIKPNDIVGIKSNSWPYLPTPPELERAIVRRVEDAGVKKVNISIDDKKVRMNPIFQQATALINVRPLRTHYLAGMGGCIKNYVTFAKRIPDYHPDNCANLALLFRLPMVKGKTRLNILSVLTPQFHGRGPHHFSRRYVWNYKGLIVGTDPVAVDTVGLEIIKAKRLEKLGKRQEIPDVLKHIRIADVKHGLGTSDLKKIELIKLGWEEDILI